MTWFFILFFGGLLWAAARVIVKPLMLPVNKANALVFVRLMPSILRVVSTKRSGLACPQNLLKAYDDLSISCGITHRDEKSCSKVSGPSCFLLWLGAVRSYGRSGWK
jgi:hypothetical protein